ncbi:MAG: hypothetical protein MK078_11335 [Crocinitomicaceae bacterium]|nr:hypothetical protein [Crocinitomicaceae bacterium]
MKNLKRLVVLAILATFASCATNNDVVSNGPFQKRKYLKGVYFEKSGAKGFGNKEIVEDEIAEVENNDNSEKLSYNETTTSENENLPNELTEVEASENEIFFEKEEVEINKGTIADKYSPLITTREVKDVRRKLDKNPLSVRKTTESSSAAESGAMLILLVLLCLILPPLAILIYSGATTWFWIDLLLLLLAIGFFFLPFLGGAGLAAVIIALLVIFDVI